MAWVLLILFVAISIAIIVERIAAARDARRFPAAGRRIEIGARRMHLRVSGEQHSGPTVILEAGLAASSLSWHFVQPAVAEFARVVSYDRAGFGWSDATSAPRTSGQLAGELHQLLTAANVPGPYIIAAHSFGAYVALSFTESHPQQMAGLILLDPLLAEEWRNAPPQQLRDLRRGVVLSRLGAALCHIGFVRLCLKLLASGSTAMPRTVVRSLGSRALDLTARLTGEVRKLPREVLPQVRAMWSRASSYSTMAAHLECLPQSAEQTEACRAFAGVPLVVISAGNAPPERQQRHAALASTSADGRRGGHIIAAGSGHWIHFDEPALVVEAIRKMAQAPQESGA